MIGYLCGTLQAVTDKYVILDVNGVGYRVTLSDKMRGSLADLGQEIKLFTHFTMNPRDGAVELYGFATPEELRFFEMLTTISGIGPKSAQAILAKAELQPLQLAIFQGDEVYLHKVAGLGPKTAQRLIIELKEKIGALPVAGGTSAHYVSDSETVEALVALGYSTYQARSAMKQVTDKNGSVENKITAALKILAKK